MTDLIVKAGVAELMLFFVLIFVLPLMVLMLLRIRRYEGLYGLLPVKGRSNPPPAKKREPPEPVTLEAEWDRSKYPYLARTFLTPADRACLAALGEALGEVEVYPFVALMALAEATEDTPAYKERLGGLAVDFLVCDRRTGTPLTVVLYAPGKGRPAGRNDEIGNVCRAAGLNIVVIEQAENYDAGTLRDILGIGDLEL